MIYPAYLWYVPGIITICIDISLSQGPECRHAVQDDVWEGDHNQHSSHFSITAFVMRVNWLLNPLHEASTCWFSTVVMTSPKWKTFAEKYSSQPSFKSQPLVDKLPLAIENFSTQQNLLSLWWCHLKTHDRTRSDFANTIVMILLRFYEWPWHVYSDMITDYDFPVVLNFLKYF